MAEAAHLAASQDDDEGASQIVEETSKGYLTPLQSSLIFELTTRKDRIASARSRADFWRKDQAEQHTDRNDEMLDELIAERKEELTRLKEARQIKRTIIEA